MTEAKGITTPTTSKIDFFLNPKTVAVVGATNNPVKFGHFLLLNLLDLGFQGKVYPVNLKADEVLGLKAYRRVDLIPDEVEVAAIIVPAAHVLQVIQDCAKKGVKGVVILSSGFREAGGEGVKREHEGELCQQDKVDNREVRAGHPDDPCKTRQQSGRIYWEV